MITSFIFAAILAPVGPTLRIPVYSADQKNPSVVDYATTVLPTGFTDVKAGSGLIKSEVGSISMSLQRSSTDMPSLLRNSTACKGDGFTTIRMTNWIGYRNTRKNGEDYKLDFHHYRVSFAIDYKDKSKLGQLRDALHALIDALNLQSH